MQLKLDALAAHLARGPLKPVYTVSGDEPLLAIEATDAIRAAARRAGYSEREVVHADARTDWSTLQGAAAGLSLFAQKRILEVRLPTGKPGKAGAEALAELAASATDDLLLLIALPKLDRKAREAAWPTALDRAGAWIDVSKVERDALPAWIAARLARRQQQAPREALEFIADRVEGNLLAAHQEIQKLALLHPAGALTLEQVTDSVLNVARYEVFGLPLAMLASDRKRVLRTMDGLRAEGEPLPLVLWAIAEEVRTLLRVRAALDRGESYAQAARAVWVRREKETATQRAVQRLDTPRLTKLLARCAVADGAFKGLRPREADSDPWLELTDIALTVASA
ncbi:MAG: DNA polymerase III subunit delta [Burkholderiales bacterium]|jgi:DNA polymerase-3 subunit delta|nr:DNA polymerase III subunit delta [Burkholderiales bacterium]